MHNERVTVSMPADQAERLRQRVAAGAADSVSAYVAEAVRVRLERDTALAALDGLWGELPAEALDRARAQLGVDTGEAVRPARAS